MTVNLAQGITLEAFEPLRSADLECLRDMFTDYLLEEFDRIHELAFGNPAAGYLVTSFIRSDNENVGFVALDPARYAVEIIYLKPTFRGHGIATLVLRHVDEQCPQRLALKAPLSPGGAALANNLGLERADNFPDEEAKNEEALRTIREGIKATCTHGRSAGDPRKLCKRCYRRTLRLYAAHGLDKHVAAVRRAKYDS